MTLTEKECREALEKVKWAYEVAEEEGQVPDGESVEVLNFLSSLIDQHFKKEIKEKIKE